MPTSSALAKTQVRKWVRARREHYHLETLRHWDQALGRHILRALQTVARDYGSSTVDFPIAAYWPINNEPGAQLPLVDFLDAHCPQVLLPRIATGRKLEWAYYDGTTQLGPFGLREPSGPSVSLTDGTHSIGALLIPALAVAQDGVRLGQGGGFYDTLLQAPALRPVPTFSLIHPGELYPSLPCEPWDYRGHQAISAIGCHSLTSHPF